MYIYLCIHIGRDIYVYTYISKRYDIQNKYKFIM